MQNAGEIIFRVHAVLRMAQRGITRPDVETVIRTGEIIERYDDDFPYPSCLILGARESRPLHVVAAWNSEDQEWIVITFYKPDPAKWYPDLKRRRP